MVLSIREKEQHEAEQRRRDRLIAARKQASNLGVQSAQYYRRAKQDQRQVVHAVVASRCAAEKQEAAAAVAARVALSDLRRGEGMRAAADFVARRGCVAQEELSAWDAERRLGDMRHTL